MFDLYHIDSNLFKGRGGPLFNNNVIDPLGML